MRASTRLGKRGRLCLSPFLAAPALQGPQETFPSGQERQGGRWYRAECAGTGQTSPCPSVILSISLFLFFFFPPDMYSCLCVIHLVSPLQAAVPSCCHCSPVSHLPSRATLPLNDCFLTPPRTGKQDCPLPLPPASGSASTYLPSHPCPHPRGMSAPTAPLPLRSRPLAARSTRRGSLTAR